MIYLPYFLLIVDNCNQRSEYPAFPILQVPNDSQLDILVGELDNTPRSETETSEDNYTVEGMPIG